LLTALLPEHLLLAGVVLLLALEIVSGRERDGFLLAFAAVAASTVAACVLYARGYAGSPFPGHFSVSTMTSLPKAALLALTLPVLLVSRDDFGGNRYYALLLSSLYGACLLVSSDSFPTMFLGLELMSLPVYVLVLLAFLRPESTEAALKYLVLGGAATATFLMGASLLYGWSGSLDLAVFADALQSATPLAFGGVVLVLAALFLKAAVVPFHAWAPDAYEGASSPVTAYMATVIKAGVLLAALRLFDTAPVARPVVDLLAILPLVSMAWGNLAAIRQTSFRRMIAYSSIAHAGYLFYAFLGAGEGRYEAIVFYLVVYGVMNLLAFAALPRSVDDSRADQLDSLKGLFHRQPFAAVVIAIAMLSLAGIPPLPGFVAKFLVFSNVLAAGHTIYAVLGLVASYLGIYFYLRVIQYMFMSAEDASAVRGRPGRMALAAGLLCLVPAIWLSFFPGWLLDKL
ncbi:MAG TPA: NADH-quinone oxidoreductase subunit N, partial [Steroidobacteraceae bacterium]|nr:NADH-quinone oxidoreductase subunit N [Steroidobacteraceae bacterium]